MKIYERIELILMKVLDKYGTVSYSFSCTSPIKFAFSEKHSCFEHLLSKHPKYEEDFFQFCEFLRMSEL